jgi:Domain of unknown function (DUF4386)
MSIRRSPGEVGASPDQSWRGLYRAGGVSGILFVVLTIVSIVLVFTKPLQPSSGGAATLQNIASNRSLYILKQVLWLGPSALAIVVFLALYRALKHLDKSNAAIGALLGIASEVLTLAYPTTGEGGPVLVYLSDQYMAATTDAQRAAFATAAEGFIAQNNIPSPPGILTAIGILVISLVMLRGVFHKGIAYLGIVTGAIGIISESLRPLLGLGYIGYGLLLPIWFLTVGWKLYRLGSLQ